MNNNNERDAGIHGRDLRVMAEGLGFWLVNAKTGRKVFLLSERDLQISAPHDGLTTATVTFVCKEIDT